MTDSTPIGTRISQYIQLRDKVNGIKAEHKEQLAPYNDAMYKIELLLQQAMDSGGLENLKSEEGTAYKSMQTSITVADWDSFLDYVKVMGAWHILEKRASKTAIEEILEETGAIPPGLDLKRNVKINVRRS